MDRETIFGILMIVGIAVVVYGLIRWSGNGE